jgi:hypothetical protein
VKHVSELTAEALDGVILHPVEIERITGGLTQPRRQVEELRKHGYWRARLVRGAVILERAHYNAVCAGAVEPQAEARDNVRPKVRASST